MILGQKVEKLDNKIDNDEAYEWKDTVIISRKAMPPSSPVSNDKNHLMLTRQIIKDNVNYIVSLTNISAVHWLGEKKNTRRPDRGDIIVMFCRHLHHFIDYHQSSIMYLFLVQKYGIYCLLVYEILIVCHRSN